MVVKRFLVLALLMMAFAVSPAQAAKRVALVIGNNNYTTLPNLNNAKKDAEGMAAKLRGLGFDVILKTNAGVRAIGRALADFENRLAKADVALVFYAGHGIQANGKNHLIPSDARIEVEEDLRFGSIDSQEFLHAMNRAGTPLNIVILDACRDNPLPRRSRSAERGLSIQAVPTGIKGTAVVYSAAPGQKAQDGPRGGHGVFTGALLKVLDEPGLKLEDVFKKTARRVASLTRGKQDPWINSSVKGDFYFKPGGASPRLTTKSADKETVFWQSIKDSNNAEDYKDYLMQYPSGTFARLAKRRIEKHRYLTDEELYGVDGNKPQNISFKDCPKCPEMVVIPAGSFRMGSKMTFSTDVHPSEWHVHNVTIPKPIAVGKFEVTQAEYRAVIGSNPSKFKGDRNPVERVSWEDAHDFVRKLSAKTGKKYRLLSEAEWEYAARAGTTTKYSWGDETGDNNANCRGCVSRWDKSQAAPVGTFGANAFGLFDMHGNVWEWVGDCWHKNYNGAPTNGTVWSGGDCSDRVVRGGSWYDTSQFIRSGYRIEHPIGSRLDIKGFRIARHLSAEELRAGATAPTPTAASRTPVPALQGATTGPSKFNSRILVRAKDDSWILIRDGESDQLLTRKLLRAGETYRVPDRPGLILQAGNAGALEISVDGETVPAIGAVGAVLRSVSLDADRLREGKAVTRGY
jgi:formylglycine-generating enzyme required for sulfatase activity